MRRLGDTFGHQVMGTFRSWAPSCLGHQVMGTFLSRAPQQDNNSWYRVELTDAERLEDVFRAARPDVVVHLAAIADVGTAERHRERATAVNVVATSSISRLSGLHGAKLVFVSTEYVFDGERGFYREDEPPRPTTHYGQTKWEAEREVSRLGSHGTILRTSIVYGWPSPGRRNFVPWLIERHREGQPYLGATDVYRTPVYVEHLTDGILKLVEGDHPGIYHVAGRDWVSMYDFAAAIAETFDLDRSLVVPKSPDTGIAPGAGGQEQSRATGAPDKLGLDCDRTMGLLGLDHPGLREGLTTMRDRGRR